MAVPKKNLIVPPPSLDIAAILESVSKNPRDRVYKGQQIHLDGYTFTNCCFSNCQLYSDSGIFALKACLVMNDCQFLLGPSALRVLRLFNMMYGNPNVQQYPVYQPTAHTDGSITIE
jgi:hypothetical protein